MDRVPETNSGYDRALEHPLELIPTVSPVTPMGPETAFGVRLLYKGKPLPNADVTFIPRGETLREGRDTRYERMTDAEGRVKFTPVDANYYLIVAHWKEPNEKGQGYDYTLYSATLTLYVPRVCLCCGE